ncbi:spore-associated protein A [Streptomyces sp. NBC_00250]|uniref:spore-associated protein A n=1 Tax=unclassified Streptomyces TaxID=2593676 RepID=UPI00224CDB58|nr:MULTISPECIES: spore-associated protein A [unclassified Streptomyces]MCX4984075.1 spore-associated protein A [Streptomyces sp. NBC_00572]
MIGTRRRIGTLAGGLAVALAAVALTPGVANAASNPYNGICGANYTVIDHLKMTSGGTHLGDAYLTYNSSNGYNCSIMQIVPGSGTIFAETTLQLTGGGDGDSDSGYFSSYAGPVYLSAKNRCIDWIGSIGGNSSERLASHFIGNSHCG